MTAHRPASRVHGRPSLQTVNRQVLTPLLPLLLSCAPSEPWDGSITPCEGEDPERCLVGAMEVDGAERTWLESRPEGWACEAGPWPLVLAFHGSGYNGAALRESVDLEGAWGGTAVFVYPDGLPREESDGSTGWAQGADSDDLAFVSALLDELLATGCYDESRVYAFGHSRGGRFANTLACFGDPRMRAFAESSAGRPDDWSCDATAPFLVAHAVDDQEIGYGAGIAMREHWADRDGCDAFPLFHSFEADTCTAYTGCDEPVAFCKTHGTAYRNHFPPRWVLPEIRDFFTGLPPS